MGAITEGLTAYGAGIAKAREEKKKSMQSMKAGESLLGSMEELANTHPALSALGLKMLPEVAAGRVPLGDFIDAASLLGKPGQEMSSLDQTKNELLRRQFGLDNPQQDQPQMSTSEAPAGNDPAFQLSGEPAPMPLSSPPPSPVQNNGNMALAGINIDGIDLKNPDVLADIEAKKTSARKKTELSFAEEELNIKRQELSQKQDFDIQNESRAFNQKVQEAKALGSLDSQKKFFDTIEQAELKPLSADAAKAIATSKVSLNQIKLVKEQLLQDPNSLKRLRLPGDATGQQLRTSVKFLQDSLGRLKSGGAINEEELKTFAELVSQVGPIDAFFESPKTALFKLNQLETLFSTMLEFALPRTPELQQKIKEARAAGFTDDEIYATYRTGGN